MAAGFAASPRRQQLLRYLIERTLQGKSGEVTEYGLALDVFGRPASFDPRLDSIVRTETSRLRQKLRAYYASEGANDPVILEIPLRSYAAAITFRDASASERPLAAGNSARRPKWLPVALGAGLLAAVVALLGVRGWRASAVANPPSGSIVVLPFQNLSPGSEYLADGVTEELTNQLAQSADLRVVARTSAFQFKGKGVDIRDIGRELNAGAALEGSVETDGDSIRVTAQLNRTSDGYHLWSHRYETPRRELMDVQTEIANTVRSAIRRQWGLPTPKLQTESTPTSTQNAEAHDLYLRGYYQFSLRTPESQKAGLDLFRRAAAADPSYVAAYIGIARAEIAMIHLTSEAPAQGLEPIRAALQKAIQIDPNSAEARGMMGYIDYNFNWDWPQAEQEYRLAVEHGANAGVRSSYAWGLATRGRFREAHQQFRVAEDLDPLGTGPPTNEFFTYYFERKYAAGAAVLRKLLEINPDLLDAHLLLGLVTAIQHDCRKADGEFEFAARKYDMPVTKFGLAVGAACRGDTIQARQFLSAMTVSQGSNFASPYQLALGYAFLHDREAAISELERSADLREGQILYLRYEPVFDEIRNDPRYAALERRVGLQ